MLLADKVFHWRLHRLSWLRDKLAADWISLYDNWTNDQSSRWVFYFWEKLLCSFLFLLRLLLLLLFRRGDRVKRTREKEKEREREKKKKKIRFTNHNCYFLLRWRIELVFHTHRNLIRLFLVNLSGKESSEFLFFFSLSFNRQRNNNNNNNNRTTKRDKPASISFLISIYSPMSLKSSAGTRLFELFFSSDRQYKNKWLNNDFLFLFLRCFY